MDWPLVMRALYIRTSLTLVSIALAMGFFLNPDFVTGILIGGLLAMGNLYVMQDNIVRIFGKGNAISKAKLSVIGKFYMRLILLGLLVYMLIKWGIQPVALVIGFSSLVVGIISLVFLPLKKTGEAN